MNELRPLRPHQEAAIEALRASLMAGHKRPMLAAPTPTGFGKTLTAAHIIRRALDLNNRVIFTVPALSLIDQTVDAFVREGIDCVGVTQGYHPGTDPSQPVQIASVQTLARRQKPDAAVVIVDEAHLAFKSVHEWMADPDWDHVPFIGLSATPWTKGLGKHFDDLIIAATTEELIRDGFLSPFVVFAPSEPDLSGVRTVAGDYHEGELAEAMDKGALVADVITTWQARGENRPTLVYGVNRAHAEHLQQRFLEAEVSAAYIDCYTERPDRERIFARFRSGETRIICNVATLAIGLDLPMCSCIVDARPTKSEMAFVQRIGRGLRMAPGKDRPIVLDHAGNNLRLGPVTDIHHDRLDDGKPRQGKDDRADRAEPLPVLCECCKSVMSRASRVCAQCGAERELKVNVVQVEGDLVEFGSRRTGSQNWTFAQRLQFYAELRGHGVVRGYAPGWAAHKFKEKFGVWPNGMDITGPSPPSFGTRNWIRSRQIAFAKARARG
jgi:DNA repair protein RadD